MDHALPAATTSQFAAFPNFIATAKTFREAAESYVENGGEGRFLERIVDHFEGRLLPTIFPFDLRQMAHALYPDASNATRNRQAITPARSVIIHGYERGWCNPIRVRKLKEERPAPKKPASPTWLHAFTRQCDKDNLTHLAALVLFMAQTGARVSEAIALRFAQVDYAHRCVLLLKTKTGTNSPRSLTDDLSLRMQNLQSGRKLTDRVFRYSSRYAVNERIKAVCSRAGISYKSSHACGRHSFATNAIDLGVDIRTAMEAGGWRSSSVFLETYVHPRRNAGRIVADRFNGFQFDADL